MTCNVSVVPLGGIWQFVRKPLHKDHINDLYTTTCSGMLGHRSWYQSKCCDLRLEKPSIGKKPVGV